MTSILLGLIPSVLLRWAVFRKPTSIRIAIAISAAILILAVIVLDALDLKSAGLPGIVAVFSFFILRWGIPDNPKGQSSKT